MDKNYFVSQLKEFSESYQINVDEDILGEIVNKATFRVISKGEIIASIGENTTAAALVLSGLARCYYIDNDGNDITRGFAPEGTMCMDEGFFGYEDRNMKICGSDGVFKPAKSEYKDGRLVVWNDDIKEPKNVRYCYDSYFEKGTYFNKSGLPLAPFTTEII